MCRSRRDGSGSLVCVDGTDPPNVVIRPRFIVLTAWVLVCASFAFWGLRVMASEGVSMEAVSGVFMAVVGVLGLVLAVRERVELHEGTLRVARFYSVDEIPLTEVAVVVRGGGRGRPAHLRLRSNRQTNSLWGARTRSSCRDQVIFMRP
jgi:hypothetical protein